MKWTATILGLGTLLVCVFAAGSVSAQESVIADESVPGTETMATDELTKDGVCPEAYVIPLGKLRSDNPDCYNAFIAAVAKKEKAKTFAKKRNKWHLLTGELEAVISTRYTNKAIDDLGGSQVLLRNADAFYRFEGGWVEKKLIRDLWVVFKPDTYLRDTKRRAHLRNLLIDAIIVTATAGWGQFLQGTDPDPTDPTAPVNPQLKQGGIFNAGVAYKLSIDKVSDTDID